MGATGAACDANAPRLIARPLDRHRWADMVGSRGTPFHQILQGRCTVNSVAFLGPIVLLVFTPHVLAQGLQTCSSEPSLQVSGSEAVLGRNLELVISETVSRVPRPPEHRSESQFADLAQSETIASKLVRQGAVMLEAAQQATEAASTTKNRRVSGGLEVNLGVVQPRGSMRIWQGSDGGPLFSRTGWIGVNFGIPVTQHVQIDVGSEFVSSVVGRKTSDDGYGNTYTYLSDGTFVPLDPKQPLEDRVSDGLMLLMPFGGRVVIPLLADRVLIGAHFR